VVQLSDGLESALSRLEIATDHLHEQEYRAAVAAAWSVFEQATIWLLSEAPDLASAELSTLRDLNRAGFPGGSIP
jgi:hypothetical protein